MGGRTVTVLCRASNELTLGEADRSLHDALCVIRSLVKKRHMIAGGAAAEAEGSQKLAQNAGLNALLTVTELRNRHANGDRCAGINVRRGTITDILEENVVQPLLDDLVPS